MTATALAAALDLAAAGYHIAPVTIRRNPDNGKKKPQYHGKWHNIATTDPDIIRDWYVQFGPDVSFCVDCEASGIVVVDLDVKPEHGIDAVAWWATESLPLAAMVVNTPTGGWHLYYRADPAHPIGNSSNGIAPGVDIRGVGGHVYAPGSRVVGDEYGYYTQGPLVPAAHLAPAPAEVLTLIPVGRGPRTPREARVGGAEHDHVWIVDQLAVQLGRIRGYSDNPGTGFRHALLGAAMMYGRAVAAGLIERNHAERELLQAAADVWGGADVDDHQWVVDGLNDGEADPWTVVEPRTGLLPRIGGDAAPGDERGRLNLPIEFWAARPSLKLIYDAALSCWACPDAVLGAVLARSSAYVNPKDCVDLGIGRAPLTLFAINYGPPSAGKGIATRTAAELLPIPTRLEMTFRERPVGSGEGVTESYFGMVRKTDPETGKPVSERQQVRANVLFVMDEGETLNKLATRNGSTIATTIRRAWSGEVLGEANASADRDRQLPRESYSIGMNVSYQPATIGPLFDANEVGGGTPHRFLFMAADTDNLPDDPPDELPPWPGPLELDDTVPFGMGAGPGRVFRLVDADVRREIRATRWRGLTRSQDGDELDGHMNQMRGRIAAHLALFDGRTDVTGEDWSLAGQVVDVSNRVRDAAVAYGKAQTARRAQREDERHVSREAAAAEARLSVADQRDADRVAKVAATLARKVLRVAPVEGLSGRPLRDAAARYRSDIPAALAHAVAAGWLVADEVKQGGTRYRVGPQIGDVAD